MPRTSITADVAHALEISSRLVPPRYTAYVMTITAMVQDETASRQVSPIVSTSLGTISGEGPLSSVHSGALSRLVGAGPASAPGSAWRGPPGARRAAPSRAGRSTRLTPDAAPVP